MISVSIANYWIWFNKNKIKEKIFKDEKQQAKKLNRDYKNDQELKKRSTKARMNLEAITKLINYLESIPETIIHSDRSMQYFSNIYLNSLKQKVELDQCQQC